MRLREVRESDLSELAQLYANSIRALGPEHYGPDGISAWAAFAGEDGFRDFVLDSTTLVAEDSSGILGFGGKDDSGRIVSLYVRPDKARRGIGSLLLDGLLKQTGIPTRFWTQASALSRPLFERFGFEVVETELVERHGAQLERYVMERHVR